MALGSLILCSVRGLSRMLGTHRGTTDVLLQAARSLVGGDRPREKHLCREVGGCSGLWEPRGGP